MYRIFIVEDDGTIAGVIRRHLTGWGYTVRCAERFDDVLSEFAAFDPHLVLLDVSGQRVELTRNECRILQLLLEHRGEIVSRDVLMTRLWESDSFVDENTLTVNIARLRRKLEAAGLPDFIRTRKGAGYLVEG